MGKYKSAASLSTSTVATQMLSTTEVNDYFQFLVNADEKFREFYVDFPENFKTFTTTSDFKQLKEILGEKREMGGKYNRNCLHAKQSFVVKMLNYLENTIGKPRKRVCVEKSVKVKNWHDAFDMFVIAASRQSNAGKVGFKDQLRQLVLH